MDRNELKVQALLEKVSSLTANYENQAADYRVEITLLTQKIQELEDASADSAPVAASEEVYNVTSKTD